MKTRPHNILAARAEAEARQAAASDLQPANTPEWHAEVATRELAATAELGLWECYESLEEYLCDFWAGLPWDAAGRARAARLILEDPRFGAVRAALEAEWGTDLRAELASALADPGARAQAECN